MSEQFDARVGAKLSKCTIQEGDFKSSNMQGVDLSDADCRFVRAYEWVRQPCVGAWMVGGTDTKNANH